MNKRKEQPDKVAPPDTHRESIPVVEEVVQLQKQVVDKGSVRIIKKVDEETINIPLISRTQSYSVERIPLNQYVEQAPPAIRHEGKTMIISVIEEEIVIQKRLKLVEEVRITLSEVESVKNTEVNLKKERIIIERSDTLKNNK